MHILLALSARDLHGYGIIQDVLRQSEGRYKLGPGTLYDNLQRLLDRGIVEEVDSPRGVSSSRRRYYRLSKAGSRLLSAELGRLEEVVRAGRLRLRVPRPRRA